MKRYIMREKKIFKIFKLLTKEGYTYCMRKLKMDIKFI